MYRYFGPLATIINRPIITDPDILYKGLLGPNRICYFTGKRMLFLSELFIPEKAGNFQIKLRNVYGPKGPEHDIPYERYIELKEGDKVLNSLELGVLIGSDALVDELFYKRMLTKFFAISDQKGDPTC